jgi:hypothetical protein
MLGQPRVTSDGRGDGTARAGPRTWTRGPTLSRAIPQESPAGACVLAQHSTAMAAPRDL